MLFQSLWKLRLLMRRLWARAGAISALAVAAALMAPLSNYVPIGGINAIDEDTLTSLLDIITNSMLAVTTFSLSIMVTAHLSADKGVTPRSHRLLQQDGRTQTVLATFVGAFVYALFTTIIINAGFLETGEFGVVYGVTVLVIILVVVAIVRWIAHLDGLGSLEETLRRVEERAEKTIATANAAPFMGAEPLLDPAVQIPSHAATVLSEEYGYVQTIDVPKLSELVKDEAAAIYLAVLPGDWVAGTDTLAWIDLDGIDETLAARIRACIVLGDVRDFTQDLAFPLIVLSEIGERALSPGINDPRTGIDVISRLTRLIAQIVPERAADAPDAPGVFAPPLDRRAMLHTTYDRLARDGRTFVEVQLSVQHAYRELSRHRDPAIAEEVHALSARALAYAEDGLLIQDDLRRVLGIALADRTAETTEWEAKESAVATLGEERDSSHDRGQA